jgi:hypothetical protein
VIERQEGRANRNGQHGGQDDFVPVFLREHIASSTLDRGPGPGGAVRSGGTAGLPLDLPVYGAAILRLSCCVAANLCDLRHRFDDLLIFIVFSIC